MRPQPLCAPFIKPEMPKASHEKRGTTICGKPVFAQHMRNAPNKTGTDAREGLREEKVCLGEPPQDNFATVFFTNLAKSLNCWQ